MRNDFCSNYLEHGWLKKGAQAKDHKYVARIDAKNGLYRYFYDMKEWLAYQNQNKEKKMADTINKGVDKLNKLYDDILTNNKYVTDDYNYDKKIKEVAKTKEWKDIVARKDREYLKTDKETGQQYMDIDSYLAKKKHPVLDAMDDIVMGREVTLNKIDKESTVAGAYDYAKTYIMLAAIGTEFLLEKFKFSQGSYKDEKAAAKQYIEENKDNIVATAQLIQEAPSNPEVVKAISTGEKFINSYANNYKDLDVESLSKASGVSQEDVAKIQKNVETITKELNKATTVAAEVATSEEPKEWTKKEVVTKTKAATTPKQEEKPKTEQDFEYKEKIKLPNGEYRYIYEEDEIAAEKKEEPQEFIPTYKTNTTTLTKNRTTVKTGAYDEELNKKKSSKRMNSAKKTWKK